MILRIPCIPFPPFVPAIVRPPSFTLLPSVECTKESRRMPQSHLQTAPSPASKIPTFEEAATQYLELAAPYMQPDTIRVHRRILEQYVFPHIGTLPVSDVTLQHLVDPLRPIWRKRPIQARRAKSLIARVLASAVASGFRSDTVNLDAIALALPPQPKPMPPLFLPYSAVAPVLATVRASSASPSTKLAFEFLLLTAARSGAVCGARWDEVDLELAVWTVPADRMNSRREHRVPLSTQALAVVAQARELGSGEGPVFLNTRDAPPLHILSFHPSSKAWNQGDSLLVPGELPALVRGNRGDPGFCGALSRSCRTQ